MPIYEYECSNCHHHFDLMQKFNEEPVKKCPNCFQGRASRLISAPSFQLKGNGWYVTDFRDSSTNKKGKSDQAGSSDSSSGSSDSTTSSSNTSEDN